jgi:hypothetical protein
VCGHDYPHTGDRKGNTTELKLLCPRSILEYTKHALSKIYYINVHGGIVFGTAQLDTLSGRLEVLTGGGSYV